MKRGVRGAGKVSWSEGGTGEGGGREGILWGWGEGGVLVRFGGGSLGGVVMVGDCLLSGVRSWSCAATGGIVGTAYGVQSWNW